MQKLLRIRSDLRALLPGFLLCAAVVLLPLMNQASGQNPQPDNAAIGIDFYQKGNYEAAIVNLRYAVKKQSKNDPVAWNYLGMALLKQNALTEARKAFEKAVKLKPDNEAWRINLAYVLLQTGEIKKALKEAEQVIQRNARNADAQYLLGEIRLRDNKNSDALEKAKTVLALNPNYAAAWLLKAQALIRLWSKTRFSSLADTEEKNSETEKSRNKRNVLLIEATDSLERYLKLAPETESARLWRSVMEGLRTYLEIYDKPAEQRTVFNFSEPGLSKPVVIYKEKARYTEEARQRGTTGTVALLILVGADGLVRPLFVIQGLPHGLTEMALEAASKMRFQPAMKDGKPVAVTLMVEFSFSIF